MKTDEETVHAAGASKHRHVAWPFRYDFNEENVTCPTCRRLYFEGLEGKRMDEKFRKYNRLLISYNDLNQAYGISDYLISNNLYDNYPRENSVLVQGLNSAAIVAYARPFSGNRGTSATNNLPKSILSVLSGDEREIHDAIITDRHTIVAHADADELGVSPVKFNTGVSEIVIPMNCKTSAIVLLKESMELLRSASEKLRENVFEQRMALEHDLKPHMKTVEVESSD